jgi:hypothetical protein
MGNTFSSYKTNPVSIVIIVIVVAVLILSVWWHAYSGRFVHTDRSYSIKCMANMKEIYIAMMEYSEKHNGNLPWAGENKMPWEHLQLLVDEGIIDKPELFICPGSGMESAKIDESKKPPFKLSANTCSYTCYDEPLRFDKVEKNTVVLCDRNPDSHAGKICICYLDQSRKYVKSSKLPDGVIHVK